MIEDTQKKASASVDFKDPREVFTTVNVRIQQEPWKKHTGYVKKTDLYKTLLANLVKQANNKIVDCGFEESESQVLLKCNFYVFPEPPSLNYNFKVSYGDLLNGPQEQIEIKEQIDFNLSNEARTTHKSFTGLGHSWVGTPLNNKGNPANPSVHIEDDHIKLDQMIYGTLKVSYQVVRHSYILRLEAREVDDTVFKDVFGAVAYATWGEGMLNGLKYHGGISYREVESPPFADEIADGQICGQIKYTWPDEEEENEEDAYEAPEAPTKEKISTWDYCSHELLNYEVHRL